MTHVQQCVYKSRPRDDTDLFYGKVNLCRIFIEMGKTVIMPFEGKILQEMGSRTISMILPENKIGPKGLICPHPGTIYMYITIIFKHHFL